MKLPRETALAHVKLMLKEMEAHTGKRPIVYTDITFHRDVLEGELHDYPHWVRSVAAEPHETLCGPAMDHVAVHHRRPCVGHRG